MSAFAFKNATAAQQGLQRSFQETNIHLFCEQGNLEEVRRCLDSGEMVDKRDTRRQTPLHCACAGAAPAVVTLLLERHADVEAKDAQLITPLHCAAMGGSADCVTMLLERGAIMNARDDKSNTPLHWACKKGQLDTITVLIDRGANVAAVNSRKQAPADVIGEMVYVKHDAVKQIKTKIHSLAGNVRAEAAELAKDKEQLQRRVEELEGDLHRREDEHDKALADAARLRRDLQVKDEEIKQLKQQLSVISTKPKGCCAGCTIA